MESCEKRNSIRMNSLHLLDYVVLDLQGMVTTYSMGRTLDISERGLKVEVNQPMSNGDILLIRVCLEDDLIDLTGKVKYSIKVSNRYETGIEFLVINDRGMLLLKRNIIALTDRYC